MFLKTQHIDHSQEEIGLALGLTADAIKRCRERILFTSFVNYVQVTNLYDSRSDAPKELTTCTGDMQFCLSMISEPLEYEYTLLMYLGLQQHSLKGIAVYDMLNGNSLSKEDKQKAKLLKILLEFQLEDEPADAFRIDPINMIRRIDLVKKSHANFDTYMNMVNSKIYHDAGDNFDLDSLLNDLNLN